MHLADKLDILATGAQYDLACACGGQSRRRGPLGRWIYPAVLPSGQTMPLLKVLLSNACSRNCLYCAQRAGRSFARTVFKPEELAGAFMELERQGRVRGLFLSSAIGSHVEDSMEQLLKTVELIRSRHRYRGWIHLKVLPGANRVQVEQAAALANRLSLNLEAPTTARLQRISPQKSFERDIYRRMGWIGELVAQGSGRCRGQTTQFVVGASDETDGEILGQTDNLYNVLGLSRVYYSAFQPVPQTPLAQRQPAPFVREHRLYQADFLLRRYGFNAAELVLGREGNLPLEVDPKLAWARQHPEVFPLEVNRASREQLLRVPGIGPVAATKLIKARQSGSLESLDALRRAGVATDKAGEFILLNGRRPHEWRGAQLSLGF